MTVGVAAVEFGNGGAGVARIVVGDKGRAFGAVEAVVEEFYVVYRADALEEFLRTKRRLVVGRMNGVWDELRKDQLA